MQYIKIHSQDNVAVALTDIAAGSVVTIDNDSVTLGGISFAAQVCTARYRERGKRR